MNYYVYLLECADGTYYCGYTMDIKRRVREHNRGSASKYTRARLPAKLVYVERLFSVGDALRREKSIKKFSRREKEKLICSKKIQKNRILTGIFK